MNRVVKSALAVILGASVVTGCSSSNTLTSALGGSYLQTAASTTDSTATQQAGQNGPAGFNKGGKGGKGGHEMGGPGGFGFPADLNLTADQIKQLQTIRDENKPQAPDQANIDAVKTAISDAFLADTFDAAALKAKLASLRPSDDARLTSEATVLVKSYAVLTDAQKQTLQTKLANPPANGPMGKLATDLNLTDAQKTSLQDALKPANAPDNATIQADMAKRKATQDAINAELKTGNASIDKIKEILKSGLTDKTSHEDQEVDRLAKIHDILTADQRKTFIAQQNNMPFGRPMGGGMGPKDGGGFGRR